MSADKAMTLIVGAIIAGVVGLGFIAVRALVARALAQIDASFRGMQIIVNEVKEDFEDFRLEAAKNYATHVALEKAERENHGSHTALHQRLDGLTEKVVRVQAIQERCRHCNGETSHG